MPPKIFLGGCITAAFLFFTSSAQAEISFRQVSISESQGKNGKELPNLEISPLWGLTISFLKTNEVVQQVRISDPAKVAVDFDAPLSGSVEPRATLQLATQPGSPGRSTSGGGASVIYLRQLGDPFKLPTRLTAKAKKSNKLPLTVITLDKSNQRKLYQFLLVLGKNTNYSTVEIVPDSFFAPPVVPAILPPPIDMAQEFGNGLALATKKNLLVPGSPLEQRLKVLQKVLQTGASLEVAAQQTNVPMRIVNQIMQLKS
jgi:hypothetical protein